LEINELTKGIIAGLLASLSMTIFIIIFFSDATVEDSLMLLYRQKKIGGLISLGALVNLPLFFLGIRRGKENFAKGVLIISLIFVTIIALLKII
tara:strand:- start:1179 stop:1460 length:282 start_codon:yes stop_codon:yes gene_type:complete